MSAQEELVVADETDAGLGEENEQNEAEGEKEVVEEGEAEDVSVHTKLYFGNLPYSVDSAQLAAIIQDYGSPELIEVFIIDFFNFGFLFMGFNIYLMMLFYFDELNYCMDGSRNRLKCYL